jgi:hypothetical protein
MSNNTPTPAPGWYPAPHANNEQRYWDGARWTDWTPESAAAAASTQPATTTETSVMTEHPGVATATLPDPETTTPPDAAKKKGLPWWGWVLIGLGALILLIGIIGAIGGAAASRTAAPIVSEAAEEVDPVGPAAEPEAPPAPETADVPTVTGSSVADARAAIEGAGFTATFQPEGVADDWVVISVLPGEGTEYTVGEDLLVLAEPPAPVLSLSQQNAVAAGEQYLSVLSFSRQGLIGQLEFEGYSTEDATFAVDYIAPDWNEQAAGKAQEYLDSMAFSRQGLYDQLAFEGFTDEQINYGLAAVGY